MLGVLATDDREILRALAGEYRERADSPESIERREAWFTHDAGTGGRPMVLAHCVYRSIFLHLAQEACMSELNQQKIPQTAKVLGILSIIFTSIGLIGALAGFAGVGFWGSMMEWGGELGMPNEFPTQLVQTGLIIGIVSGVANLVANAMGLAGGIGLLKRKPWAIPASNIYAIMIIVLAVASYIVSLSLMGQFTDYMQQFAMDPETQLGVTMFRRVGLTFGGVLGIVGIIFTCAYPVVLLILMNRDSVKSAYHS